MFNLQDKISCLENYLLDIQDNYADSFKTDISIFFGDFESQNSNLDFLNDLTSSEEIETWVNNLTSRIVLKFEEDNEQLNDFIFDYIQNG